MTQVQLKSIAGRDYIPAPEGLKLWVVYQHWPGGRVDQVAAYFKESLARAHAGSIVGDGQSTISLQTIPVQDDPRAPGK